MPGCIIEFGGDGEDHQRGQVSAVQHLAGDSTCAGGASEAEHSATTLRAADASVAGGKGVSLTQVASSFPTAKESEVENDGGASEGEGLSSAAAPRSDDRRRGQVRRVVSSLGGDKGGDKGGLDPGGRSASTRDTTVDVFDGNSGTGKATANKVRVRAD